MLVIPLSSHSLRVRFSVNFIKTFPDYTYYADNINNIIYFPPQYEWVYKSTYNWLLQLQGDPHV